MPKLGWFSFWKLAGIIRSQTSLHSQASRWSLPDVKYFYPSTLFLERDLSRSCSFFNILDRGKVLLPGKQASRLRSHIREAEKEQRCPPPAPSTLLPSLLSLPPRQTNKPISVTATRYILRFSTSQALSQLTHYHNCIREILLRCLLYR